MSIENEKYPLLEKTEEASPEKQAKTLAEHVAETFKDLGCEIKNQDIQENGKIIITVDTFDKGVIEINILPGAKPEILITNYDVFYEQDLRQVLGMLKKKGINNPFILLKKGEQYPLIESSENPPILPPSARELSTEEWQTMSEKIVPETLYNLPSIGTKGLRTKYGIINGQLTYCNTSIAIFETSRGMIEIPFSEILDPFGKPYGEKEKHTDAREQQPEMRHLNQ